ncbi:MAG: alpha/beta hydrolase [Ilumatobacteraceae bacterium]
MPTPFVREWGDGPIVLFIHGLGGSSRYWDSVANVATGFRGVAVDLIGFGLSPKPGDFSYDVDDQIDAIHHVCPIPDVVVGHSIGAIVAAAYVRTHAPSAPTLLIGAPAYATAADAKSHLRELGWLAAATVEESRSARLLCGIMCTFRPLAMRAAPLLRRDVPAAVAADSVRHTWDSYSQTIRRVLLQHRLEPDIAAVTSPTIALHGSADRVAPIGLIADLATRLPHVQLRRIDSGDHHVALSHPGRVADSVAELLDPLNPPLPQQRPDKRD